jgi:hypothetical protein
MPIGLSLNLICIQYSGVTGNVGIGIQSPQEKLHVIGDLRLQSDANVTDSPASGVLQVQSADGTRAIVIDQNEIQSVGGVLRINKDAAQEINLMGDKVFIKTNGHVGIGTARPMVELSIKAITGDNADFIIEGKGPNAVKWDLASVGSDGRFEIHDLTSPDTPVPLRIEAGSPEDALHLRKDGTFVILKNLVVGGLKSSNVETSTNGCRRVYTREAAEVRLVDEGRAKLVDGKARVDLDPVFMEMIEGEYIVHLTAEGPSKGLYVAERHADHFIVRENSNGASNLSFVWMLTAARRGYAGLRLEKVD